MNKKFKKITAILMSALIISSVATLTACTDTGTSDSNKATNNSSETANNSSEATRILTDSFENKGGIYVEGVFPEGAMLSAFFFNKEALYHLPITDNLHWYEYWFETNTVAKLSKFYHGGFSLDIFSAIL